VRRFQFLEFCQGSFSGSSRRLSQFLSQSCKVGVQVVLSLFSFVIQDAWQCLGSHGNRRSSTGKRKAAKNCGSWRSEDNGKFDRQDPESFGK
jgi:hypothetical protein